MQKKIAIEELGLKPMTSSEMKTIDGGDTGYYGKGPDLGLAVKRITYVAHQIGDFFRGLWGGMAD